MHKVRIFIQSRTAEASGEDFDWLQGKLGAHFRQSAAFRHHLVVTDPHAVVADREAHHSIDERLRARMMVGYTEDLNEEFFQNRPVRSIVELRAKGQDGSGAAKTVSGQVQLQHRVDVAHEELGGRPCGWHIRQPQVEIHLFASFKEYNLVGVLHFRYLIDHAEVVLTIQLCVGFGVGQESLQIIHEMPAETGHTTTGEDENASSIGPFFLALPRRQLNSRLLVAVGRRKGSRRIFFFRLISFLLSLTLHAAAFSCTEKETRNKVIGEGRNIKVIKDRCLLLPKTAKFRRLKLFFYQNIHDTNKIDHVRRVWIIQFCQYRVQVRFIENILIFQGATMLYNRF